MDGILEGKRIILGVCGGIAAYKSVELVRLLGKEGAQVRVVMTQAATAFVGPITFEALSGKPVWTDLFQGNRETAMQHIAWADDTDAVVIAPATANIIGKMAHGIADDPLTTLLLAVQIPVMITPSMNVKMYQNRITQDNLRRLKTFGFHVLEPAAGPMACGDNGLGRLPKPQTIVAYLRRLVSPADLEGVSVLITAGPTREPMDPVRFLSNPSSGKMGYALARAAYRRGAKVVLVSGPTCLDNPFGVRVIRIGTAEEMKNAVLQHLDSADIIIKAAAVSDYSPIAMSNQKIKKGNDNLVVELGRTPDILTRLGQMKGSRILVGFAAETERVIENAEAKLKEKNLDLIVANDVGIPDSGFGADTNRVTLIFRDGRRESLSLMTKDALADLILDRVVRIKQGATVTKV
jgi:phosphopantothenoylcysteine decarboxylase/phosphopantothenate--cysteine ligase